jgi:hypothetical protein
MRRRQFLLAGAIPFVTPGMSMANRGEFEGEAGCPNIYSALVAANDRQIPSLLLRQETQASHSFAGGVPDLDGIYTAGAAAGFIKTLASVYCAPESKYHRSKALLPPLVLSARFLLSMQHPDGTIDLHTTNFHSTPDTAFVVEPVALAALILAAGKERELDPLLELLKTFLQNAGKALSVGGIHTPNHRWVVCSALARLHSLYPEPGYLARIDNWLGEGIDIDADGQFTERSTSVYSPVCDLSLATVARLINRPQLLEPVRRNLEMTLFYLHADGEVATEGSRRQDQYARGSTLSYYIPARYMAIQDKNGRFSSLVRTIEAVGCEKLAGSLAYFLENPVLRKDLPAAAPLPDDFARRFQGSELIRVRRKAVSATILNRNPVFFSFHKGSAALEGVRLAAAFFGKGQFEGEELQWDENRCMLSRKLTAPYYQPLAEKDRRADGDWNLVDRNLRARSEVQSLNARVTITENKGRFELEVDIDGCDRVPVSLELGFRRGGRLSGVSPHPTIPDAFLLGSGNGLYEYDGQTIEFGPGPAIHRYVQIRGGLPKPDSLCAYITGFTPFKHVLFIS